MSSRPASPALEALTGAVEKGLRMRAHSRDAIAQFLMPPEPWERTTFRLEGREHLRHVKVAEADIGASSMSTHNDLPFRTGALSGG